MKYQKNIINEQFILNRIANSAIDIYATAVVLSRANNSLKENLPSAEYESMIAQTWCSEVIY